MVSQDAKLKKKIKRNACSELLKGKEPQWRGPNIRSLKKNIAMDIRSAEHKFFPHDLQSMTQNNPKKFWAVISPRKDSGRISLQDNTGAPISEESSVAFNNFFYLDVHTRGYHSRSRRLQVYGTNKDWCFRHLLSN